MIDTHCHLTFHGLEDRVAEVVSTAAAAGVDRLITVATTPADARRAVELTDQFEQVFAAVGLHPHYADQWHDRAELVDALRAFGTASKVVALGEMGLDRHYPDPPIEVQRRAFGWQLELAATLVQLPVIIHNREATQDTLNMIRQAGLPGRRFVFHCFTGDRAELEAVLAAGAMVSFTGVVTFKNSQDLAEASDLVPINRLMIETDAPYLTPEPHRKVHPNEPRFVTEVGRFLAARRDMSLVEFTAQVDSNADRFFRLPAEAPSERCPVEKQSGRSDRSDS